MIENLIIISTEVPDISMGHENSETVLCWLGFAVSVYMFIRIKFKQTFSLLTLSSNNDNNWTFSYETNILLRVYSKSIDREYCA